jgi:predicted ATPase/DNA-binding SARP family transcriptional activator
VHKKGLMAHLSLGVLGSLQVLIDDTPVTTLESDKVCALLAYLAVEADRPHRREFLVGLLWPDFPEQTARHNLRQALFNLRLALGDHTARPPYLLISRNAIQFNRASDFSLDLAQFNTIFYTCEENRSRCIEDCSIRAARLEEMVKLYRGQFLEHFFLEDSTEFEEWALVQRESSHQHVLEGYSYLTNYYELHRDFEVARRHAIRQLELDPWREEAHCQVMRALALDGQRSAALVQYETCRRVLAEELGVEPSAKTRELYEQIRTGKLRTRDELPSSIPTAPIYNLPVSLTPFLGREQELIDLGRLIADPECRCISLVGPGGIGKTRLALQTAEHHQTAFAHGVVFIPLASVGSIEAVIPAIAGALHFSFWGPNNPKEQLLNNLREKQMLLILDNVEHLIIGGPIQADIVELMLEILQRALGIKLLATSREALNLQEEWIFDVQGLAFPEKGQTGKLDEYAAVALFTQRARRATPGFVFNESDLAAAAHICRLVEGMPLAIELAATWLRTLSPTEIAKEIEASLDFLSTPLRDLPERHRSMRVVFDHSWRMLSTIEQQILSQLSVFRGGFSRQAAEQVAGASLTVLSALVSRTLLRRSAAGRYNLHELIRQYCAAHLAADPRAHAAAQKRHYNYFLVLAEAAERELKGRNQLEWLGRLEREHGNLRVALEWALESDLTAPGDDELALQLAGALRWYWRMRGHFHEGRDWLMQALQTCPERPTAARASALLGLSMIMNILGDLGAAHPQAEESAAIFRKLGNQRGLAEALSEAGVTLIWQGEATVAFAQLEEALTIYRKAGDRWGEAQVLYRLGGTLLDSSCDPMGRDMLEESIRILADLGEKYLYVYVLIELGVSEGQLGNYPSARTYLEQALAVATEIKHPGGVTDALTNLGYVFRIQGEYLIAQSYLEAAHRVYQEHGSSVWEIEVLCSLAENAIVQGDFSAARLHILAASNRVKSSEFKLASILVCHSRGLLAYYQGDAEEATELLEKSLELERKGTYKPDVAWKLIALARVMRIREDIVQATELVLEALDLSSKYGRKLGIAIALEEMAAVKAVQGDGVQAAMLFSTAHVLREVIGAPLPPVDRTAYDSVVAACRTQLGETAFAEAWEHAAASPFQEMVEEVLKLRQN